MKGTLIIQIVLWAVMALLFAFTPKGNYPVLQYALAALAFAAAGLCIFIYFKISRRKKQ